MTFSNEQAERYSRQLILKETGVRGQEELLCARVLITGAGGLGSPAAMYLVAVGVGTIGIAEGNRAELSKLRRQIFHDTGDAGRRKADSARDSFKRLLSDKKCLLFIGKKCETAHSARISGTDAKSA